MSVIVHSKIQKWDNCLALRVTGLIRDVPKFEQNTEVAIEVFDDGFSVKKAQQHPYLFPYSEAELLAELTPETTHADALTDCLPESLMYD